MKMNENSRIVSLLIKRAERENYGVLNPTSTTEKRAEEITRAPPSKGKEKSEARDLLLQEH
jgi:hypothetical protein